METDPILIFQGGKDFPRTYWTRDKKLFQAAQFTWYKKVDLFYFPEEKSLGFLKPQKCTSMATRNFFKWLKENIIKFYIKKTSLFQ